MRASGYRLRQRGEGERRGTRGERMNWRGEMGVRAIPKQLPAKDFAMEPRREGSPSRFHLDRFDYLRLVCGCQGICSYGNTLDNSTGKFPLSLRFGVLRQSASRLRVQPGPAGFRPSGDSSGEQTSAGACNSQLTHRAQSDRRRQAYLFPRWRGHCTQSSLCFPLALSILVLSTWF